MKNTVAKLAFALVAVMTMTGCPGKPKNNNNLNPYYGAGYNYGGAYCQTANCYGTVAGHSQMFVSALGKIQSSALNAEIALNFNTSTSINNFSVSNYAGNTTMIGTMNVYSSGYGTWGGCQIPPGQYQLQGAGTFGSGYAQHSFTGEIVASNGYIRISFPNTFLTAHTTTSIMGPSFPFAIQNEVYINGYGCGSFIIE